MEQKKACQYDAYMLHAPKTCVHGCMRTCKMRPIWPMILAKPATTITYKLLIPTDIRAHNIRFKI